MFVLGILSGLLILPLVGAAFILRCAATRRRRANAAGAALITTIATFLLSLVAWGRFDRPIPASSSSRISAWLADTIRFKLGRRRHLDAVRPAHDLPDAVLHPRPRGRSIETA